MRRHRSSASVWMILSGLLVLALVGTIIYFRIPNTTGTRVERANLPALSAYEPDSSKLAKYYPRHWDSYQKNYEQRVEPSKWGGSVNRDKLEQFPQMVELWKGYGFSKEYTEDRGHVYSMIDVTETGRQPAKGQCLSCKSTLVPQMIEEMGTAFYTAPFADLASQMIDQPIGCSDCHNTQTMELRISRPALITALEARDVKISELTRNELRTLVCAQCHVEYYFTTDEGVLTFPWKYGLEPEDALRYYEEIDFVDFTHPDSQVGLLKAQHPDYEMFYGSIHYSNGVSCADCHMPYITEGNVKITSHWWTSPLKTINQSCSVCHRQSAEELTERVFYIQDRVNDLLVRAGEMNVEVVALIAAARNLEGVDIAVLAEASRLQRQAQWYWDWVGAENSMGFHNSPKAMNALGRSLDLAGKALAKVVEATGGRLQTE